MSSMQGKAASLKSEIESFGATGTPDAEQFRLKYISKKGSLSQLFEELKSVPTDQKREAGRVLNELKQFAEIKYKELTEQGESSQTAAEGNIDLTLPPVPNKIGNLHPLTLTRYRIIEVFERLGFSV